MSFKRFAMPTLLATGILLAGCSDKEDTEPVKEEPTEEVVKDETVDTPEEKPADEVAPEEDPNSENNAVSIFLTYFEGINEEDVNKINSVYSDEVSNKNFEQLFGTFDIQTEVESYEVISQNGTEWTFDAKVKFVDESGTEGYTDNLSGYQFKVDTATGKITYLEVIGTQDL